MGIFVRPRSKICIQPLEVLLNAVALDDATPHYQVLAADGRDWTDDEKVYCHGSKRAALRRTNGRDSWKLKQRKCYARSTVLTFLTY